MYKNTWTKLDQGIQLDSKIIAVHIEEIYLINESQWFFCFFIFPIWERKAVKFSHCKDDSTIFLYNPTNTHILSRKVLIYPFSYSNATGIKIASEGSRSSILHITCETIKAYTMWKEPLKI